VTARALLDAAILPVVVGRASLLIALVLCLLIALAGRARLAWADDPVLVGAGDIAACDGTGDEATADLLDAIDGTVATFGDNVYPDGTATQFADCYDPTWGRHKARTMPSAGNHEYNTANAAGYYGYFGAAAGDPTKGYHSYDLGAWHIIVINSNCSAIGGCDAGSAQEQWLRADLAANPRACTLAYWHHPRFSSSTVHGNHAFMQPVWQALYDYSADIVLGGHDHDYERFAPQDPAGNADPRGIRQFIVGTGGRSHYPIVSPIANSELYDDETYGVLKLTLHPASYDWQFIPEASGTFTDSGTGVCVNVSDVGGITRLSEVSTGDSGLSALWGLVAALGAALALSLAARSIGRRTRAS
jgi:hypothetical protein